MTEEIKQNGHAEEEEEENEEEEGPEEEQPTSQTTKICDEIELAGGFYWLQGGATNGPVIMPAAQTAIEVIEGPSLQFTCGSCKWTSSSSTQAFGWLAAIWKRL